MATYVEIRNSGAVTTVAKPDALMLLTTDPDSDPASKTITVGNFANSLNQISANGIPLMVANTPSNSTPSVKKGVCWFDSQYFYIATDDNTVKRVTLSSF